MSVSDQTPLTRRAAREAARATGEQPNLSGAAATGGAPRFVAPAPSTPEPIAPASGEAPLTRRRLRELRDQGVEVPAEAPAALVKAPAAPAEAPVAPVEAAPAVAPEPVAEPAPAADPVEDRHDTDPQPPHLTPAPSTEVSEEPRSGWAAPAGHWTRQLDDVDEDEALETTFSREVRAASPTTSALIIPQAPAVMDLSGPLDSTGEILLTGSIPLSPSLAATGAIDQIDATADDRFDDARLREHSTDSQPVRAAAIASQHALGTPIVSDGKTRASRGLTILLIAASSLAVIVTGLVVTALVLRWI